ncbi:MAG: hypothetical protein ACI4FX_04220 [Agathobacter sp.]
MKKSKRIFAVLLALVMACSVLTVEPVSAKVTMPAKSATLVKRMSDYVTMQVCYSPKKSWTKIPMNNETCFSALVPVLYDCEGKYEFSSEKQINNLCYKYFGRNGYKDVTTNDHFYYSEGRLISAAGDWGTSAPQPKITKMKKVKDGVYDVYVTNRMKNYEENTIKKVGESVIRIKKNSKSAFGYVVIGMKYKTTYKEYFEIYG